MGRREDNKRRVREDIRRTALALYRERGFEETRVHDIIERVGISEKTFFNYFPSKQAVLDTYAADAGAAYQALLEHHLGRHDVPVPERLADIVALWAQSFADDREFQATVTRRTALFFGSSGATRDQQHATQQLLADLLREGQRRGEIRRDKDALQLAELLTASLLLTTVNWLDRWWPDVDEPLRARLETALDVFLTGAADERPLG